jgi:hypothetical protein
MRAVAESIVETLPGEMHQALKDELVNGWKMEAVRATVHQNAIGQSNHRNNFKAIDGIGRLRMRVDPTAYHYWGQRIGYGCWDDAAFLRRFEQDNPAVKVDCAGTKLQVGYSGKKKFRKVYQ